MIRQKVESSNITSIGFDASTLEVEFTNGSIYQYAGVPCEVHTALMAVESKGKFLNARIKNKYPFTKLEPAQ